MYGKRAVPEGPALISATRNVCFVRRLLFTCVYYNNGNSLPFFSIPISWGYFGGGRDTTGIHVSSPSFTAANQAIDSIFCDTDVLAPYWLEADLPLLHGWSQQAQSAIANT